MISLQLFFNGTQELQSFLEKMPDSKRYLEIQEQAADQTRKNKNWTKFEDEHIIAQYYHRSAKHIGREIQRTHCSVSQRIMFLKKQGLLKDKRPKSGSVKIIQNALHS